MSEMRLCREGDRGACIDGITLNDKVLTRYMNETVASWRRSTPPSDTKKR